MDQDGKRTDEAAESIAAYLIASEAAADSAHRLREAWKRHLEGEAGVPASELVAEVAELQAASDAALATARAAAAVAAPTNANIGYHAPIATKTKRRRRRENKFLAALGRPGQRFLRGVTIVLHLISLLIATGAGISLALEFAGLMHLIDDPVQLPVGIQLAIFIAATAGAFGFKNLLEPVERALYGSKGIRPKRYQL